MRSFQSFDGFFFERGDGGEITIARTKDGNAPDRLPIGAGNVLFRHAFRPEIWASIVLAMTAFDERRGDWQAFLAHHQGKRDLFELAVMGAAAADHFLKAKAAAQREVQ